MREYIHQEVQNRQAYGRFTALVRFVKNIAMRKDLKTLLRFSDYQLRDIGVTRAELCCLLDLPTSHDLAWELERSSARDEARSLVEISAAGHRRSARPEPAREARGRTAEA